MAHHEKKYVAIKQHEGAVACAVVVDDTGVFVREGSKVEHIGDGLIVNIINEGGLGFVVVIFVVRDEARHDEMMDAQGTGRAQKGGLVGLVVVLCRPLRGRFMWPFDVRGLGIRYILDRLGIEMWGASEEASIDGLD